MKALNTAFSFSYPHFRYRNICTVSSRMYEPCRWRIPDTLNLLNPAVGREVRNARG